MSAIKGNIKVTLEGRGQLILRPNDHIATGGEGIIFRAKNTIVKIYSDRRKILRNRMPEKIKLLSAIKHDYIVAPKGMVIDDGGKPIGFYMAFVDGEPFPRVFTNDFRRRQGFTDKDASILVDRMRETVQRAHGYKAVMVDANELNWIAVLSGQNGPEPRIIDVDSWAIGRWPATVIMPSIRDWHTPNFCELSDWFAWGIVSFQVYTGIHPYKGRLDGFKMGDFETRMKVNASVFTPGIGLNQAVRDFSLIPGPLLDWYVATFQQGARTMPPSPFDIGEAVSQAAVIKRVVTTATGLLIYEKIFGEVSDPVIRIFPCGVILLQSGRLIDLNSKRDIGKAKSRGCEIVKVDKGWLKADLNGPQSEFSYINGVSFQETPLQMNLKGVRFLRFENRLFLVTEYGLVEMIMRIMNRPILAVGQTWGVMTNATRWFDGVGIQDAMGATYVIAPFSDNSCAQVRVKELDGFKPIAAKAGNRFITILAMDKKGGYHKFELTFSQDYATYKIWRGKTDIPNLNIAILPKGVCATIVDDGELDIFVPTSGAVNKVMDKKIRTDMALAHWDNKVLFIHRGEVWHVRLK